MTQNNQTKELKEAIAHVSEFYPSLKVVIFTSFGWQYMEDDFTSIVFDDRISVSILERAMDSIDTIPSIFEI